MGLLFFLIAKHLNFDPSTLTPELARDAVRKRMEPAIPRIAARLQEHGFTPPHAMPGPVIQEALFQLWREVVPIGTLADAIRDEQSARVREAVLPRVVARTTLMEVVTMAMTAALHEMS